jgi:proteasome lid subunit RPN8/RPN11
MPATSAVLRHAASTVIPRRRIAYNQSSGSRHMTDSGTDSTTLTWSVPECPFTIESSARVLDDIRLAVTDAFFSLPRGGAEIGGILLGKFDHGRLVIGDYAALDCEHAHGPSFVLSPPDEARLKEMLSAHTNHADGLRPVGWYHSHTRSEIFLSDADLEIHHRFFPESWQVALVVKPHTFQPARIGFFFRQADGSVHANASYREDSLDALSIRPMPAGAPTATPWNDPPPRNFRPAPVAAPVPESAPPPAAAAHPGTTEAALPLPEPAAVELPVPKFVFESASSARRWMVVGVGIVAAGGILGAAFQVREMWLPQMLAAIRPAPPVTSPPPVIALGLNTIDRQGQLQINWDRNSPAVRRASDAILEITDGGPLPVTIQLDTAHLETGSFTYARTADKVDVLLIVHRKDGPDLREVTSFLGKLPDRQPAEDPEAQREQREEAAKLKADMSSQAAKTRKLEQEVRSMREELRQRQRRRLNNQLPDK